MNFASIYKFHVSNLEAGLPHSKENRLAIFRNPKQNCKNSDGKEMIYIPAGPFIMGSNNGNWDELPERETYLEAFYIDECSVIQSEYQRFVDETEHQPPFLGLSWSRQYDWKHGKHPANRENCSVVLVCWKDAQSYCRWAGKRLPTEAEWEKASRGVDGRTWPWGNEWDNGKLACVGSGDIQPVGQFEHGKSPFGCYDMSGNVWEWVADWYSPSYYRSDLSKDSLRPENTDYYREKVLKGGSWIHSEFSMRCAMRYHKSPKYRDNYIGFRCAMSAL